MARRGDAGVKHKSHLTLLFTFNLASKDSLRRNTGRKDAAWVCRRGGENYECLRMQPELRYERRREYAWSPLYPRKQVEHVWGQRPNSPSYHHAQSRRSRLDTEKSAMGSHSNVIMITVRCSNPTELELDQSWILTKLGPCDGTNLHTPSSSNYQS